MPNTPTFFGIRRTAEESDWLLLVVPGLIWGASFLFIAEGMRSVGPGGVTFLRILIGFVTPAFWLPGSRSPGPNGAASRRLGFCGWRSH